MLELISLNCQKSGSILSNPFATFLLLASIFLSLSLEVRNKYSSSNLDQFGKRIEQYLKLSLRQSSSSVYFPSACEYFRYLCHADSYILIQ